MYFVWWTSISNAWIEHTLSGYSWVWNAINALLAALWLHIELINGNRVSEPLNTIQEWCNILSNRWNNSCTTELSDHSPTIIVMTQHASWPVKVELEWNFTLCLSLPSSSLSLIAALWFSLLGDCILVSRALVDQGELFCKVLPPWPLLFQQRSVTLVAFGPLQRYSVQGA